MTRRLDTKAETRQLILTAAQKLFRAKGVEAATMRSIAREAGVSPASIVVHFKSKTALLEAALHDEIEQAVHGALGSLPPSGDLPAQLLHVPAAMFRFYAENRGLYRALIRNTVFEPEEDNPLLSKQLDGYISFLASLLAGAKTRGELRPESDPLTGAQALASLYIGVLISFFRNPAMPPELALEMLAAITRQHLTGILIDGGR